MSGATFGYRRYSITRCPLQKAFTQPAPVSRSHVFRGEALFSSCVLSKRCRKTKFIPGVAKTRRTTTVTTSFESARIKSQEPVYFWTQSLRFFSRNISNWQTVWEEFLSKPRTIPIPRWITPKHSQVTASECFGHASFVLVAASYAVDDFLLLRMIAVAGSSAMLVFTYFHPHGRVLWLPFKWNVLFIAINSYRIGMVYWNRYMAEQLPAELMELREKTFYTMDPVDYYRLMRIAEIKEYKKGDLVLSQGEHVCYVRLVLSGQLRALRDGKLNYLLEEGNFISEIGIHAGLLLPGKIESCCTLVADGDGKGGDVTRVLCWNRTELVHLMELYQGVRRSIKSILTWDIVRKLKFQRLLLVEHLIDDPEEWTARRNRQTNHRYAAILQAVLQKPQYLEKFRKEINKYRTIHHIDDDDHAMALEQIGWTVEEFEAGKKKNKPAHHRRVILFNGDDLVDGSEDDDDFLDSDFEEVRTWRWYLQDIYLRLFG
jgi:CRP-like cAMP-binding protein